MSTTLIITRNVSDRIRGFLASSMLEISPGVYVSPRQSPAVRSRIWNVLEEWFLFEKDASIVLVWQDNQVPGGLRIERLGLPPLDLVEIDGLVTTRRPLKKKKSKENDRKPDKAH